MSLKALIFDVDGTLAATEELHRRAFNQMFEDYGLDWHWDRRLYRHLLGITGGKERISHYMDKQNHPANDPMRAQIPVMHSKKTGYYAGYVTCGELELRTGVLRLMKEAIANDIAVAIATTTSLDNVNALLETNFPPDVIEAIKVIGAGDMVNTKKPAPDVYKLVIERLGFLPCECLAFEDSRNGLLSATTAGISTLITPDTYTDDHDFTGAIAVVSDLGEPDRPFVHIAGQGQGHDFVSLAMLQDF